MPFFETDPIDVYYGSYTDRFISGSMVSVSRSNDIPVYVTGARGRIGSAVAGGNILGNINQVGPYLRNSYLSQSQYQKSQRFIQLTNKDRQYHDTFIPEMSQIFSVDGVTPSLVRDYNAGSADTGFLYVYLFGACVLSGASSTTFGITSSAEPGVAISNNKWICSFPYQNRYRNVERRRFPSSINNIKFGSSASLANSATVTAICVAGTSSIKLPALSNLTPYKDGNIFWSNSTSPTVPQSFPIAGFVVTGGFNNNILQAACPPTQPCVILGTDFKNNTTVAGLFNAVTFANIIGTDFIDSMKFMFGVGDSYNIPNFLNVGWYVEAGPARYATGPHIRGWKYGMLSGLPLSPKYIWMRNKYGQFRHMLEQSQVSKTVDLTTGTVFQSPVRVTFISGSISWETEAWVTASNPSLNTRDSGFYDKEYKVGQPFSDS